MKSAERTSSSDSIHFSEAERANNNDNTVLKESSDSDMLKGCQEKHPEVLNSNLNALKFLAESEPRAAMEESTIRFMWSPQTGDSLYWIQGEVSDASNPRKEAEKDKSESNNVTVKNLMMANCWGEEYNMKLPKTMTIELNRKLIWALGTEATLDTKEENEAFEIDLDAEDKIRNDINATEDLFVHKNYGVNNSRMSKADPDNHEDKDPPMDGLELWFSPLDFRPEFDVVEDTINDSNMQVVF